MMECEPETPLSSEKDMDKGAGNAKRGGLSTAKKRRNMKKKKKKKKQSASSSSSSSSGSGLNAIGGGDLRVSEKSKKEKVRSLSAVGKALSSTFQMASPSSNRFKLPTKISNHCNGVDHASVPRKMRSAMKKRSRESTLSDSEKVSHKMEGIESPEKDGIKKSKKQRRLGWSTRQAVCGAITKDEEEVAEALYALAGMFPHTASNTPRIEPKCESLPEESANATFEASDTTHDASPYPEISPRGAEKITSFSDTIGQEKTDFSEGAKLLVPSQSTAPKINLQAMPMMVKGENRSKVALRDSELCLAMGLNVPRQSQSSHIGGQPDKELETVGTDSKQELHMIKDRKENEGPGLWPGLSSKASAGNNASYLRSSAAKAPGWLNAAICASKQDLMEGCSSGGTAQISETVFHKKSWKRCAAHVHISHLIRSLEMPKRQVTEEPDVYGCHQMRVHQGSKCGVRTEVHTVNGMRNGITTAAGTVHSFSMRNLHENKNGILQQQGHYRDTSQAPPTPRVYGPPQNQSFNLLSLSAGDNALKVNDSFNRGGSSRLEPLSKLQVPYFQTLQQQHGLVPIPTPQSQYALTSYQNQLPVAGPQVRLQQPHYYGSPLSETHYSSTVSNKQQHQSFWAVQQATQGRSAVNYNMVRAQYHNWQGGWHDSSAVSSCAQVMLPHSPASLEALGSKITSISEQQLFALASSLPPSRTNGLDIHVPSVYEESRGRFRSSISGTPSLQLLCDERI